MFSQSILLIFLITSTLQALPPLKFSSTGEFTILQLTDLHFCKSVTLDSKTSVLQNNLLQKVKPDIVVITGDIISASSYYGQANFFSDCWKKFIQPFANNQIPYALALGVDDLEADVDQERIAVLERSNEWSLYAKYEMEGTDFAYSLPIQSSKGREVVVDVWIFNTHGKGCLKERNSWGCVDQSQIEWFEKMSKKLREKNGEDINQIAFFHTPLPEFLELYNEHEFYGDRNEKVNCPLLNTGLFEVLKRNKVDGVFVGHDHLNDYGGFLDGVELAYGRKTGYAGYGGGLEFPKGGRVIKFKEVVDSNSKKVKVVRDNYLVAESLKEAGEFDFEQTKFFQLRKGWRQNECRVADTHESFFEGITWIITSLMIILMTGIVFNRIIHIKLVSPFQRNLKRGSPRMLGPEKSPKTIEYTV